MSIRPSIQLDTRFRNQFVGATKAAAHRFALAELAVLGKEWLTEVVDIVSDELPRREGDRHKANTTHLEDSFTYHIIQGGDGGFPMTLELTIKPGVNAKKVAALEFGADHDYEISPSGVTAGIGGRSQRLTTARRAKLVSAGIAVQNTQWLRWEGDDGEDVFMHTVIHKAFPGVHFMSRARDAVLARRRRRR